MRRLLHELCNAFVFLHVGRDRFQRLAGTLEGKLRPGFVVQGQDDGHAALARRKGAGSEFVNDLPRDELSA